MFQYDQESVEGNEEAMYPPQEEYRSTRSRGSPSRRKSRNHLSSPRTHPYYEGEEQTYEEEESYHPSPTSGRPPRHSDNGRSVRYEDPPASVAEYSAADTPKYADAASVAQSVAYTAYTMNMDSGEQIIEELRNVGVNVLSVESSADMFTFIDEVTKERSALAECEQRCLLYTDDMERVFNVVISGGTEGMSKLWEGASMSFSGWLVCATLPFVVRVLACPLNSSAALEDNDDADDTIGPAAAMNPLFLVVLFGLVLFHETSLSWANVSIGVRGTSSIAAYVWLSNMLTDYPRSFMLLMLGLASFAPEATFARDLFTVIGTSVAGMILASNLGARAWKKLGIEFLNKGDGILGPIAASIAAFIAGILFPYIGMTSVNGGTFSSSSSDDTIVAMELTGEGQRARQLVTAASVIVALIYFVTDLEAVQNALGFHFQNRGEINSAVAVWWTVSTIASLSVCHRIDKSKPKRSEPFLKRHEASPVGYIVPSIPNIVVDPSCRAEPFLIDSPGATDFVAVLVVGILGATLMWRGFSQLETEGTDGNWFLW